MSAELGRSLDQDRALRDAALAVLKADIANVQSDLAGRGIGERVVGRISAGAVDIFDEAAELADNNRGILATLIGAVLVWFARNPIIALFTDDEVSETADDDELADGPVTTDATT